MSDAAAFIGPPIMIFRVHQFAVFALLNIVTPSLSSAHYVAEAQPSIVHWDDGDSGEVDGLRFRLADVDAPETGGVGARIGGAKCQAERELGKLAKKFMEAQTSSGDVTISALYDFDRQGRQVLDMSVDGSDLAQRGLKAGHLRSYKFEGHKRIEPKPNWCL